LTPEQVKKINEISKLPKEKQQEELGRFLKTLNKEQIDFLQKQQQGNECPFCLIASGEIESYKVYENNDVVAVLDIKPANEGHVLVIPKNHVQFSTEMDDVGGLFNVANKIAKRIFEVFGKDTNIFVANGVNAGQRAGHLIVHVIPRDKDDGVELEWEGKNVEKKTLDELKGKLFFEDEKEKPMIKMIDEEEYEEGVRIP